MNAGNVEMTSIAHVSCTRKHSEETLVCSAVAGVDRPLFLSLCSPAEYVLYVDGA